MRRRSAYSALVLRFCSALPRHANVPAGGPQLAADEAQQCCFSATTAAHDGHHLPRTHTQIDAAQYFAFAVCEAHTAQFDQRF